MKINNPLLKNPPHYKLSDLKDRPPNEVCGFYKPANGDKAIILICVEKGLLIEPIYIGSNGIFQISWYASFASKCPSREIDFCVVPVDVDMNIIQ